MQGQADPPLDAVGVQQAQALAEHLRSETLHALYSSPLLRARATAEAIARYHSLPTTFDARLMERHLGEWTGLTGDEASGRYPEWLDRNRWVDGPPGGESQATLTARAVSVFNDILAAHSEDTVAVVSHGGLLWAYVAHLLSISPDQPGPIGFPNAAFARVLARGAEVRVLSVGELPRSISDSLIL